MARWAGVCLSTLLLATWIGTHWVYAAVIAAPPLRDIEGDPGSSGLEIGGGALVIRVQTPPYDWVEWRFYRGVIEPAQRGMRSALIPKYHYGGLWIPLWLPLVLVAGLTGRAGRLARPKGCCRRCGYELTGNTTGLCPECGAAAGTAP